MFDSFNTGRGNSYSILSPRLMQDVTQNDCSRIKCKKEINKKLSPSEQKSKNLKYMLEFLSLNVHIKSESICWQN